MFVRFWASARAAAGIDGVEVLVDAPITLAELVARLGDEHGPALARILPTCSVLLGDTPVGSADPADVVLSTDAAVEFLPPFAGG